MPFLSSDTLKNILVHIITPFDNRNVKHGAYELKLGNEFFTSDNKEGKKSKISAKDQIVIKPGQFAFLITEEEIYMPDTYIGFISIKYSFKKRGLINVSGFHIDPGFKGKIKFSVYNAGAQNILLTEGEPTFLIWFGVFDNKIKDLYNGNHQNQQSITNEDVMIIQGEIASPNTLKKEIEQIKAELTWYRLLIVAIFIFLITNTLKTCTETPEGSTKINKNLKDYKIDSFNKIDTTN